MNIQRCINQLHVPYRLTHDDDDVFLPIFFSLVSKCANYSTKDSHAPDSFQNGGFFRILHNKWIAMVGFSHHLITINKLPIDVSNVNHESLPIVPHTFYSTTAPGNHSQIITRLDFNYFDYIDLKSILS